jgi:hypothetical protein
MEKSEVRELRGPQIKFPVDVTAYDAAPDFQSSPYKFGASKERTVALIREVADRIEAGAYLLQGIESNHKVALDDYTMSSFTISFAQKVTKSDAANESR